MSILEKTSLSGTVIIFGHTSQIGSTLVSLFLERGAKVVGIARSSLNKNNPNLVEIQTDLSDNDEIEKCIEKIRTQHSDFQVLLYASGLIAGGESDDLAVEDIYKAVQVNTIAAMQVEGALLDLIKANAADVMNMTSSAIDGFYPEMVAYSTSKAMLRKFTEDLRQQLSETQARVCEFCPGRFTSEMYDKMIGAKVIRDQSKRVPARIVAELIMYLLELPKAMEIELIKFRSKIP